MSPEAQNYAIARALGKTHEQATDSSSPLWGGHGRNPDYVNYAGSLDAMHEAEKILTDSQWDSYGAELSSFDSHPVPAWCGMAHMSAANKAEAFLRALGLWAH